MKKIISILLALLLVVAIVPASAFAVAEPSADADAGAWERYADFLGESNLLQEAAAAYKIAAEKYCEYIETDKAYFNAVNGCYNKAIELYKEEDMYDEISQCFEDIGDVAFVCDKYKEAKFAYAQAIRITLDYSLENDNLWVLYEKFGDMLFILKEYRDAADEYSHAIERADPSVETYGSLCLKYAQALELAGPGSDPDGEEKIARAFTDAAGALAARGKGEEAIAAMKNGAKHYENAGDLESAKRAYSSLVFEFMQAGNREFAALLCFELYDDYGPDEIAAALFTNIALPYYESIEDYESAALAYEKAGDCYKEMGDKDLAKQCYEKAAEYYEKAGNSSGAEAAKEKAKNGFALGSILSEGNFRILMPIIAIAIIVLIVLAIKKKR